MNHGIMQLIIKKINTAYEHQPSPKNTIAIFKGIGILMHT